MRLPWFELRVDLVAISELKWPRECGERRGSLLKT